MAKKRIGELKGKPIVIGDSNLITKNEINVNHLNNSNNNTESESMGVLIFYYSGNSGNDYYSFSEIYDVSTGESKKCLSSEGPEESGSIDLKREVNSDGSITITLLDYYYYYNVLINPYEGYTTDYMSNRFKGQLHPTNTTNIKNTPITFTKIS